LCPALRSNSASRFSGRCHSWSTPRIIASIVGIGAVGSVSAMGIRTALQLPMPAGIVALSGFYDFTLTQDSMTENASRDRITPTRHRWSGRATSAPPT
jgi:hypothetical protein